MALVNCTINSSVVAVTSNQAVGGTANQVLTITPDPGYVVAAADFTKQSPPTGISSITLADKNSDTGGAGTPYADNNVVTVTCDLDNSYNPGTTDQTLTIDIDGAAKDKKVRPYTYAGQWSQAATDFSPSPISANGPHSYSGSLLEGEEVTIFAQTYTASANHTMTAPTVAFGNSSYASDYTVTIENTAVSEFGPTAMKITCKYKSPAASASGHTISITKGSMIADPTTSNLITGVRIDESLMSTAGETRRLYIYGNSGCSFRLYIRKEGASDSDDRWYNFSTDEFTGTSQSYSSNYTMNNDGIYYLDIEFPEQAVTPTQAYVISVIGGTSPSTNTTQGSNDNNDEFTVTLNQKQDITVTTTATGTNLTAAYVNNVATANPSESLYDDFGNLSSGIDLKMTVTHSSGKALYKRRQPVFSDEVAYNANNSTTIDLETMNDFTNTVPSSDGDTEFNIAGLNITSSDGATSLVIESGNNGYGITSAGPANIASVLNLDNFINQQPTANALSISTDYETATNVTLTGSDPESDTLTFTTTVDPSNGSLSGLNSSTGAITYTPNNSFSGSDSFKFKVNDGIEDSAAATVSVTVGSSGSPAGPGSNYVATLCSPFTGTVVVSGTAYCNAGNVSIMPSGFMGPAASSTKYLRFSTVGGCSSSHTGYMQLTGATTNNAATHYSHGTCTYDDCSGSNQTCI